MRSRGERARGVEAADMTDSIPQLIDDLQLAPHPEGGYYRETYRSAETDGRAALTSIYYLLVDGDYSAFHRIDADEAWHHYRGDDVHLHLIDGSGKLSIRAVGASGPWQTVVPAGSWFAAESRGQNGYALVGCDVAPGFSFEAFEIGDRDVLLATFPQHRAPIQRFTRIAAHGG